MIVKPTYVFRNLPDVRERIFEFLLHPSQEIRRIYEYSVVTGIQGTLIKKNCKRSQQIFVVFEITLQNPKCFFIMHYEEVWWTNVPNVFLECILKKWYGSKSQMFCLECILKKPYG